MKATKKRFPSWLMAILPVVMGLAACLAAFRLVESNEVANGFEGQLADRMTAFVRPIKPDPDIVVVVADRGSPRALGKPSGNGPLEKVDWARVFQSLADAGASVVLSDVTFNDPSEDKEKVGDKALRNFVSRLGPTRFVTPTLYEDDPLRHEPKDDPDAIGGYQYKFRDLPFLGSGAPGVWVGFAFTFKPDAFDIGVNPVLNDYRADRPISHVALLAALLHRRIDPATMNCDWEQGVVSSALGRWELDDGFFLHTLWGKNWDDFRTWPVQDVLGMTPAQRRSSFEGKVVVVGESRDPKERVTTVRFGSVPGVFAVANTVNTFLTSSAEWPRPVPIIWNWVTTVLLSAGSAWSTTLRQKVWRVLGPLLFLLLAGLTPVLMMKLLNMASGPLEPVMGVVFALAGMAAVLIVKSGSFDTRHAGTRSQTTVLFVDLKDSTVLTNTMGGTKYQSMFTKFERRSHQAVAAEGGRLERTTGDGFIATFPEERGSHSTVNCWRSLLRIKGILRQLAMESGEELSLKAGVECGMVTGGFVKEDDRSVWSSAGPTVNLSQRLLSACDATGAWVAFGPVAARLLSETTTIKSLGKFELKGFEEAVEAFTVESED